MNATSRRRAAVWSAIRVAIVLACVIAASGAQAQTQDAFFNDETLQDVGLFINARDWQRLKDHPFDDVYYPADLHWKGTIVRNVGIRSRGADTRNGIKPGLSVDLNRYVSDQQFLGLRAFTLDNGYSDPSLIRDSVTMKMFARMGIPAPREAHVRLFVNNEFAGVYVATDAIDRTFIARTFGAAEGELETGGFLFKYEWVMPYGFEDLGSRLDPYVPMFKPETRETDSIVALYAPISAMVAAINASPDSQFASGVGRYLDLRLFMTHLAVETFMAEQDGLVGNWGLNNFYLYRFSSTGRSQLIPWDKDRTFGGPEMSIDLHFDADVLVRRAMAVPELRQTYFDALLQCAAIARQPAADDPRGWLEREIDRQAAQIQPAVAADPGYPFPLDAFRSDVGYLGAFARVRPSFIACQVANATNPDGAPGDCMALLASAEALTVARLHVLSARRLP